MVSRVQNSSNLLNFLFPGVKKNFSQLSRSGGKTGVGKIETFCETHGVKITEAIIPRFPRLFFLGSRTYLFGKVERCFEANELVTARRDGLVLADLDD